MRFPFLFLSGLTWLDFVNTRPAVGGERVDLLATPGDVVQWIRAIGGGDEGIRGLGKASRNARNSDVKRRATLFYVDAMDVRDRLEDLARRTVAGRPLPPDIQAWIGRRLGAVPGALQLIHGNKGETARIEFVPKPGSPAAGLFPVVRSAATWLAAGGRPLIKACGNPDCVLYFADATKSGTRRWCNAASCGNRSRVSAFRKRRSAGSSASE